MNFDWSSVKYIFQVPLEWFKSIHRRVFNAYGSNFIVVKEGQYGGMEIGLDTDALNNQISVDLTGVVKSVDEIEPDANGNVELNAARLSEDQTFTGDNIFSKPITLGNSGVIGDNGTSLGISHGQNGISLNGINAQLLVNEPSRLYSDGADAQIASRAYCRLNFARTSHDHGNINNDGTITTIGSGITTDYIIGATSTGELYRKRIGDLGFVKSVNSETPDSDGNVTIDCIDSDELESVLESYVAIDSLETTLESYATYTWVENQGYLTDADLSKYVTNTALTTTLANYVTNASLTTTLNNYATLNDIADFPTNAEVAAYVAGELFDYVKTVDGHTPDANGAVSFYLTANKWMKTDSLGHIGVTDEQPVAISPTANGYLYANAGTLEFKTGDWVTLSTSQTITGAKTIADNDLVIYDQAVVGTGSGTTIAEFNKNGLTILDTQTADRTRVVEAGLQVVDGTTGNFGYLTNTAVILGDNTSLTASLSKSLLELRDTTTGKGTAITKDFIAMDSSGAYILLASPNTTANNSFITLDQNDNNKLAFSSPNGIKGTSPHFGFNGLNNSHVYLTPDYGAFEIVPAVQAGLGGYIDFHTNGYSADYTSRIIDTTTQFVLTTRNKDTVVQAETANDHVVLAAASPNNVVLLHQPTDTSTNSLAVATVGYIQTKFQNAQTTNVNCVTGVSWNGTQIVITSQTLGFTNGLLTSVTNNQTNYIETVAYTQS